MPWLRAPPPAEAAGAAGAAAAGAAAAALGGRARLCHPKVVQGAHARRAVCARHAARADRRGAPGKALEAAAKKKAADEAKLHRRPSVSWRPRASAMRSRPNSSRSSISSRWRRPPPYSARRRRRRGRPRPSRSCRCPPHLRSRLLLRAATQTQSSRRIRNSRRVPSTRRSWSPRATWAYRASRQRS